MILAWIFCPMMKLDDYADNVMRYSFFVLLGRFGFALLQWGSRTYVLTDRRLIRIRGVFTIDIFQCNLNKIQNTFLILTLPERILGLGSIALTTAGTGAVEAIWRHVKSPLKVHRQLLNALNQAGNAKLNKTENNQPL